MKQGDWYLSETRQWEKIISVYDEKCHGSYPPLEPEERVAIVPNIGNSEQHVALITAAPDLLDALQDIFLDCMACDFQDEFLATNVGKKARAAINKATGEKK